MHDALAQTDLSYPLLSWHTSSRDTTTDCAGDCGLGLHCHPTGGTQDAGCHEHHDVELYRLRLQCKPSLAIISMQTEPSWILSDRMRTHLCAATSCRSLVEHLCRAVPASAVAVPAGCTAGGVQHRRLSCTAGCAV